MMARLSMKAEATIATDRLFFSMISFQRLAGVIRSISINERMSTTMPMPAKTKEFKTRCKSIMLCVFYL